jgi:hypothetical protein
MSQASVICVGPLMVADAAVVSIPAQPTSIAPAVMVVTPETEPLVPEPVAVDTLVSSGCPTSAPV